MGYYDGDRDHVCNGSTRAEDQHERQMNEYARGVVAKFEEYIGTFLKHPIHAKAFAIALAEAQQNGVVPTVMDITDQEADCTMYLARQSMKDMEWKREFDLKNMYQHFGYPPCLRSEMDRDADDADY